MEIINFGSLNLDHVYRVDHFVRPGETMAAAGCQIFCGGKGLNQSIAAARAGGRVRHAGAVGAGGERLRAALAESGVDTSLLLESDEQQGHAVIQVSSAGENCILLFRGSNFAVTREYIDRVFAQLRPPAFVMLQNEISNLDYIVDRAHALGFTAVLNASPIDAALLELDLGKIGWLMVNEIEGEQFTGEHEPEAILAALARRSPDMGVVLTLGEQGVVCQYRGERVSHGIYRVQVADTTAAGDTFSGYFVATLARGGTLAEAARTASLASALAVSRPGASPSIPTAHEVAEAAGVLRCTG